MILSTDVNADQNDGYFVGCAHVNIVPTRKVFMMLTPRAIGAAEEVALKRGGNQTDAVQRGLALQRYLEEVDSRGGRIYVEMANGNRRRVVLD